MTDTFLVHTREAKIMTCWMSKKVTPMVTNMFEYSGINRTGAKTKNARPMVPSMAVAILKSFWLYRIVE